VNPHWPKVQQWQRDDSMLLVDMINSLLGNPVERPKYESLLADNLPVEEIVTSPKSPKSLLADDRDSRLAPRPKEKPTPRGSLQDIAAMVANDQKIPADFLISNVLDPIAWHESNRTMNPLIEQKLNGGGVGKGKGMFQFEGKRGVKIPVKDASGNNKKDSKGNDIMGNDSFDVAINRAKNYFGYKGLSVPSWINDIQDGTNATSLSADQQKALALLNFTKTNADRSERTDTKLKKLYNDSSNDYKTAITNFWAEQHHKKADKNQKKTFMENLNLVHKVRTDAASL